MLVIPPLPLQNSTWAAIADLLDAKATPGKIRIYSGTRPASGGELVGNTMMCEVTLQKPCTDTIFSGVLTMKGVDHAQVVAAGSHKFARFVDGDGGFVMDMDTGIEGAASPDGGTAAMLLQKSAFSAGEYILITSLSFSFPT